MTQFIIIGIIIFLVLIIAAFIFLYLKNKSWTKSRVNMLNNFFNTATKNMCPDASNNPVIANKITSCASNYIKSNFSFDDFTQQLIQALFLSGKRNIQPNDMPAIMSEFAKCLSNNGCTVPNMSNILTNKNN